MQAIVDHYPHRRGSVWCYYQPNGEWKTNEQFAAEQALLDGGVA